MPTAPATPSTTRRMMLLSVGTLASRLLGMVRETLIAATFTVVETDAFFIAWRIPNALRALLAEGALSAALVPVFSSTLVHGEAGAAKADRKQVVEVSDIDALLAINHGPLKAVVARVRALSLAALVPLSVAGMVFAEPLLRLMAGDFGGDATRFTLSAHLLRQLFPYIFFMGSAAVGIGVLQSLGRMAALAFAPALLNVAFLLAPFAFVPLAVRLGCPAVDGLAWAAMLGGVLQLAALIPALRKADLLPAPVFDFGHPAVKNVLRLMGPQLFGLAIYQVDVVLSNRFLASLPAGATSWFSYAQRIADIPQGLFILAIANSYLPELSRCMAAGEREQASTMLATMLRLATFVSVPVAVLLATYGEAVVPLIYGYGRFQSAGPAAVLAVVASLRWQALNVALLAMVRQLTATFSAAQDTRTPVLVSAVDLVAFVVLAYVLRGPMGHAGVAAAIAGSTLVQLLLLLGAVHRHARPDWVSVLETLCKSLGAALVMALAARWMVNHVPWATQSFSARLLCLLGGAALGTVYLLAAWLLRIPELQTLQSKVAPRLRRLFRR